MSDAPLCPMPSLVDIAQFLCGADNDFDEMLGGWVGLSGNGAEVQITFECEHGGKARYLARVEMVEGPTLNDH